MPESNADFAGQIELDVRDSVPDWSPYELQKAPDGAPNVLVVLYDDTGVASWSPYGGRISMPTMDRLARRAHVHAVAHDGAVLPDPIDHAHRSKPPREPRGGHHGGHQRVPRIGGTPAGGSARRSARSCSRTATRPSGWARTTTSRKRTTPPAGTDRCGPCSSASTGSTDSWGGEKERDQQLVPGPGRGQPLHRGAGHAGTGLPPVEGPRRPGPEDDPQSAGFESFQALVPLPRSRARGSGHAVS